MRGATPTPPGGVSVASARETPERRRGSAVQSQRYSSRALSSVDFDLAPLNALTTSPPTYTWMVGSPRTWLFAGVTGLVLVSILTKVTLSPCWLASSSMIGPTCLQGPHQSAQ